ncbi:MAG: CHAT domain-containing protein [Jaaginema sp. PMC 1079.18]|nr:CHAT domain-containing protein [Jaaginema sp. PMC 1080.18]MEC4849427.1 CHAT domain-containing protein [Jaaginema sp. PMC 1079.18]MEC4864941.1 CHAT domain-containing protein [Jaaginema sp. PMC 1078.18]
MFQDFQLSVTPIDDNRYLLRTENVPVGIPLAEVQVEWDVEDWLRQARQLLDDPLMVLFQGDRATEPTIIPALTPEQDASFPASHPLRLLGQRLYSALFTGLLRDSWVGSQCVAHNKKEVLRLQLGLKGDLLHRVPWEILHPEGTSACGRFLATNNEIAFSRYYIPDGMRRNYDFSWLQIPTKTKPIRILMAIAGPNDQETLDLQQEAEILREELRPKSPGEAPKIDLQVLSQPGRDELTQALERGHYDVFHYAGHSQLGDAGGNIYLVSPVTTLTETLAGEDLGGLLANNGVKLAVFNSCRSADTAWSQPHTERSLARTLAHCGIPSVLAMAEEIPDEAALRFARLFYRNLEAGYPIDLSLNRARQCLISTFDSRQLYWALPVLYLHEKFSGFLTRPTQEIDLSEDILKAIDEDIPLSVLGGDRLLDDLSDVGEEDDPYLMDSAEFRAMSAESLVTDDDAEDMVQSLFSDLENANSEEKDPEDDAADIVGAMFSDLSNTESETESTTEIQESESLNSDLSDTKSSKRRWWPWIVGGMGTIAIASLGLFYHLSSEVSPPLETRSLTATTPSSPDSDELSKVNTENLTSIAIEQLNRGNLEEGDRAVTELLDRNTLPLADAALKAVPPEQQDQANILFLKGRLAWQSLLNGSKDYSLDDARRYWEQAVEKAPANIEYHNALGFAYYEEKDYNRANQAWSEALELGQQQLVSTETQENDPLLTTYAGLAIALSQMASDDDQTDTTQKTLINKAIKLRQLVLTEAPVKFQTESLSQNWLWSEQAIQDWQDAINLTE